ncbi:MAG: tRNA pseudouridine(55) synthase TruB [Deltaproteobacteria bacterium]|nr:MAG: tRNA pseudouridine(55) synthase TruB [Deltaproteobacteria bacterium]
MVPWMSLPLQRLTAEGGMLLLPDFRWKRPCLKLNPRSGPWRIHFRLNRMRPMESGILLIDKPRDMTSAKVVAIVKRLTGAGKAGHTGTLDPMATGLLVCCLNQATRLARFLLTGTKTYEAVLRLGVRTDTQDTAGQVLDSRDISDVTPARVEKTLRGFIGTIQQQPPAYSALKHDGKPLYQWAREGKPVAKPPRTVIISALEIQKIVLPEVHFRVNCSAGTYIRTLCADAGDSLGCGGHLAMLRRTASCGFSVTRALNLEQLEKMADTRSWRARLISPVDALPDISSHQADDVLRKKIKYGQPLGLSDGIQIQGKYMKIIDSRRNLLAIIDGNYRYCCVFPDVIQEPGDRMTTWKQ